MKRIVFVGLYIITLVLMASCQKRIALFNHVPKNYYTRHHSNEIKSQPREPILCLQKSKKDNNYDPGPIITRKDQQDFKDELTASKNAGPTYSDFTLRPFYEQVFKPKVIDEPKELEIEKFGFFSSVSGIFAILLSFLAAGPYYFGAIALLIPLLATVSLIFGIQSLKRHKRNPDQFRGKGYAYTGLGIGLFYLLVFLLLVVYYFSFYLY